MILSKSLNLLESLFPHWWNGDDDIWFELNCVHPSISECDCFWRLLLLNHSVMSNSLRPHGLQHARCPCLSPSPRVCSNSCPVSQWCHSTILSSAASISSCPQSFPASRSFPVSQLFALGGQSIRASASILPMNIQSVFPWGLTGLVSFKSKEPLRVLYSTTIVVELVMHVWLFVTPWTAALQSSLSFTVSQFAQTHVHWVGDVI